jgi:predicted NUDIX family phosphoesterase
VAKDMKEMEEYVLVFPTDLLKRLGDFQGLSFDVQKYLDVILDPKNHRYMKRKEAETDFLHKQLIPYVILHHKDKIFTYRRGKLLAEKRLMGNCSIGIGGHISVNDPTLFGTTYQEGLQREVNEEIIIETTYKEKVGGLINDDSNEVGKVHFGIIHTFALDQPLIKPREKSINETGFSNHEELRKNIDDYENWSKICINGLDKLV